VPIELESARLNSRAPIKLVGANLSSGGGRFESGGREGLSVEPYSMRQRRGAIRRSFVTWQERGRRYASSRARVTWPDEGDWRVMWRSRDEVGGTPIRRG